MVDESVYFMWFVLDVIYEPDINPSINVDFFLEILLYLYVMFILLFMQQICVHIVV